MTKEEVYDAQISPLMKEVIRICKEADIPLVADFQLDNDRTDSGSEDTFHCTTTLVPKDASSRTHKLKRIASKDGPDVVMTTFVIGGR